MKYPFEFEELLLTDYVLDQLGFTNYHDGAGDFGDRRLDLGVSPYYLVHEIDAKSDENDGYGYMFGGQAKIEPGHFCSEDFGQKLYFLHDLYEDITFNHKNIELNVFIEKCYKANCGYYLDSYLEYKNNQSPTN
jgi:hypothetical protein